VDIVLEGYGRISKAEGHNRILVVSITGTEGYLPFIALLNANSVVGVLDIDLAKDLRASESV
jgi:hypothetical protein